jgi:hypothetical protein
MHSRPTSRTLSKWSMRSSLRMKLCRIIPWLNTLRSYGRSLTEICLSSCRSQWPAGRSKAWTVFARSNAEIVGSNSTRGMDVCVRLFCVCVVLCIGSGLVTDWSPVQGVLPTVCIGSRNWKSGQGPTKGLYSHNNNSIQFNSILYYLCAEPTATRPITGTAQCRYK